jgi:hypothetical protein
MIWQVRQVHLGEGVGMGEEESDGWGRADLCVLLWCVEGKAATEDGYLGQVE